MVKVVVNVQTSEGDGLKQKVDKLRKFTFGKPARFKEFKQLKTNVVAMCIGDDYDTPVGQFAGEVKSGGTSFLQKIQVLEQHPETEADHETRIVALESTDGETIDRLFDAENRIIALEATDAPQAQDIAETIERLSQAERSLFDATDLIQGILGKFSSTIDLNNVTAKRVQINDGGDSLILGLAVPTC